MSEVTQSVFREWTELFDKMKDKNPENGTVLTCEDPSLTPELVYDENQDFLYAFCVISRKILTPNKELIPPYFVLAPKGERPTESPLKVVIVNPTKRAYLHNREHLQVKSITVLKQSNSKKSVLGELDFR